MIPLTGLVTAAFWWSSGETAEVTVEPHGCGNPVLLHDDRAWETSNVVSTYLANQPTLTGEFSYRGSSGTLRIGQYELQYNEVEFMSDCLVPEFPPLG